MLKHVNQGTCEATSKMSVYQPDTEMGGFGTGRHFSPDIGLETIKTDPNAYSKIIRSGNRVAAKHLASHPSHLLAAQHHAKVPHADKEMVAKISNHHPSQVAMANKPQSARPKPSVTMTYGDSFGHLGNEPVLGMNFDSAKSAFRALVNKEISMASLVHFSSSKFGEAVAPAYSLKVFLGA